MLPCPPSYTKQMSLADSSPPGLVWGTGFSQSFVLSDTLGNGYEAAEGPESETGAVQY